jgi:uncharacterized protein HemX
MSTPVDLPTSQTSPTDETPSKSSAGSIAGIVFAVLVFVGLVIGGVVWWIKNKDSQEDEIRVKLTV